MSDINQIIDSLGRTIKGLNGGIDSLSQQIIKASNAIGEAVKLMGEKGVPGAGKDSSAEVESLKKRIVELERMVVNFSGGVDDEIEERIKIVKQIKKELAQERLARRKGKENVKEMESLTKKLQKAQGDVLRSLKSPRDATSAVAAAGTRPRTVSGVTSSAGGGGGGGGAGGGAGGAADFGGERAKKINEDLEDDLKKRQASWASQLSSILLGGQSDILQLLFTGAADDTMKFRKEARGIAFELEGMNASTRGMQAEFADMGEVARRTGKSVDVMQRLFLKNAGKGFKKQGGELKNVLKSGMHLSTMIGSNVEETGSMFADWNRTLGMSVDKMNQLAIDAKGIASSTGVTGDELLSVMKSSEGILKNLRNQGNLTSEATKNVIEAMTVAKSLGIEDKAAGVLDMLTSTNKLLEGDATTRNFILKMSGNVPGGRQAAMRGTTMNDPKMLKGFVNEMNNTISKFTHGQAKTVEDMEKLSSDERMKLSMMLKNTYGMEMYEFKGIFDSLNEQSKTLGEKFSKLEGEANNTNESLEKRNLAEQKITQLMVSSSMGFVNKFTEEARKGGKDFNDAMKDVNKSMTDAEKQNMATMMKRSGIDASKTSGLGESRDYVNSLLVAAESMKKQGKEAGINVKDFGPELLKAAKKAEGGGGSGDLVALVDEMTKVGQEIGVKKKTGSDPMTALGQNVNELNETLRKLISGPLGMLIDTIGSLGLAFAQVALVGIMLFGGFGSITRIFGSLGARITGLGTGITSSISGLKKEMGGLGKGLGSFDDFAKTIASSDKISEGFFKKFMKTYSDSRKGSAGLGWKVEGKGVMKSLDNAFGGLRDDMLKGLSKMRGGVAQFFRSFGAESSRFFGVFAKSFRRSWNAGIGKSGGLINVLAKSFSSAMKSGAGTRKVMNMITGALGNINAQYIKYMTSLTKSSPLLAKFVHHSVLLGKAFATLNFGQIFFRFGKAFTAGFDIFKAGMRGGLSVVKNIFNPKAWKGMLTGAKSLFLGGKGLRAAILTGSMGTAQIIFSAIDMMFGAVSGFSNTGKNFEGIMKAMGKSTKDMTWGMYASSTVAGALVGILDGLTFGLLGMTGATKWLNETLSLVMYTIFSVVEGIVNGIMGAFKMVGSAFSYIGEQFKSISDSVLGVFNSIAGIFGFQAGSWSEAFAALYPWLKKIGTVIGFMAGTPIAAMLWLVVKGISAAIVPLQMLINAFAGVIKIISGFVKFFVDIFKVGLWQATKNLFGVILDAVYGVFKPVIDFVWSIAKDIIAPFKWLWDILVGHSIIPDLCTAIVGIFGKMAQTVLLGLGKFVFNVAKFFLKLPFRIMKGLFNTFVKWPIKQMGRFVKGAGQVWAKLSPYVDNFFSAFKKNLYDFTMISIKSWKGLLDYISGGWFSKSLNWLKGFGKWIDDYIWQPLKAAGGKILKWADDYIVTPLKNLGGKIAKLADDWLVKPFSNAIQTISQKFSDYLFKPVTGFLQRIGLLGKETAKTAGKATAAGAKPAASVADDAAKAGGKGGWFGKLFGQADEAAKAANPFTKMSGTMGKAAQATLKAQSLADEAAKAANPFAKMSGTMGKAAQATSKSAVDDVAAAAGKGWFGKLFGKAGDALKSISPFGSKVAGSASKATVSTANDAAKVVLSSADDIAKAAPKALGFLGKASKFVGVAAKKLPVVGPLIDFGVRKMTGESTGKAATGAAGGLAGGLAGAAAGAAVGSVVPVIGTAIGGLVGGIAGSLGGGWLADKIYDNVGGAFDALGSGLKSTFVDFPMWLGGKVMDGFNAVGSWIGETAYSAFETIGNVGSWIGEKAYSALSAYGSLLKSIYIDFPIWLAGKIKDGLQAIFVDLPVWLGSTILGGISSLVAAIPSAMYQALYSAASAVGLGWVVKKMAGGGGGLSTAVNTASEAMSNKSANLTTPVGQHAIPVMRDDQGVASVQPIAPGDAEYRLRKERVEGEAGSSVLRSDELTSIEKVSQEQYAQMQKMTEVMETVASYLRPSATKVGSANEQETRTKSVRKNIMPRMYGELTDGKPGKASNPDRRQV